MKKTFLFPLIISIFSSGCTLPGSSLIENIKLPKLNPSISYKADIRQGNVFTKSQVNQIYVGMTLSQIYEIMGSPIIQDPFHDYQLDYINRSTIDGKSTNYRATIYLDRYTELVQSVELSGSIPE